MERCLTKTRLRKLGTLLLTTVFISTCALLVTLSLHDYPSTNINLEHIYDPHIIKNHATSPPNATTSQTAQPRILLVSALFPLPKSKHTHEEYAQWLSQFLGSITTDIYFYTTPEMAPVVRAARGDKLPITIDTRYVSPFDIPPLKGKEDAYIKIHELDREKFRHNPSLYAIWNAKPWLTDFAVKTLAKQYDYIFWNDAGSFRMQHVYTEWPNPGRVEQVWTKGVELTGTRKEDLLFFPITGLFSRSARYWKEADGPVDRDISEGSFFGGSPSTIAWWSRTFYAYHDYYLSLGIFVGKDQTLINALFLLYPERVITMWQSDPSAPSRAGRGIFPVSLWEEGWLGACGQEWFYYQFWLADQGTRERMRDIWSQAVRWKDWEWWRTRERCRMTGVLSMKQALENKLGPGWKTPMRSLVI